ncbi:hypothetical protein DYB25_003388 [Aphanomyces astaci]|uniref:BTB domain-containing protein n=1 Tax=Aphanomyces astaci TaxID=112090 RepID=A0A397B7K3_APHAT|nr:hypothetical protein DYB25_003388 [Aphanomyces astaci]
MKSLPHKHIVQYHGVKQKKRTLEISMEYMPGGSLSAYIRAVGGSLTMERTKQYTWQLVRAVQFLHDHRIAHRKLGSPFPDIRLSSPVMSPQTSPAGSILSGAKSMAEAGFPTLKMRPELRRIATAPQSVKRLGDSSPKALKLPPLSARGVPAQSASPVEFDRNIEEGIHKFKKISAASDETIVIHVCDEFRKVNKDFVCNKVLLLDNMKYFKAYLNDASNHEDIDISVHCDVSIFEWLFNYIHADGATTNSKASPSTLAVDNVTSILISSDFLQMDFLVSECASFISQHLEEVVGMPGDLLCISDSILDKIAAMCTMEQLDAIEVSKDKLCYKLYTKRLHRIVSALKDKEDGASAAVECCVLCGVVYYTGHRGFLVCRRAKLSIGRHGNIVARHEAKPEWKLDAWVKSLTISFPARQAFWKVWGAMQCLYCVDCHECYYHDPSEPTNDDSCYGCCGAKRFAAATRPSSGCKIKAHTYASINYYSTDSSEYAMPEVLERLHQLVASHADLMAREPPATDMASQQTATKFAGVHEMLAGHVKPQISMLATCDVSNELMKAIKSNLPEVSTPQTRKQWKIDLLQEKDRIRVQMLSSALTKMRVEYKVAKGSQLDMVEVLHTTGTLVNDRNQTLWYQKLVPQQTELRGLLLFIHGILEHSSRYTEFLNTLAAAGFAVYALDLIGHGRSEGERGYFDRYTDVVDDVDRVLHYAKAELKESHPNLNKTILVGLSFGGLVTNLTLLRKTHEIHAAVLCAPAINVPRTFTLNVQAYFGSILSDNFPKWRVVPGVEATALSAESDVLAAREQDDLITTGLMCARVGNEILLAFDHVDQSKHMITLPVLIVVGTAYRTSVGMQLNTVTGTLEKVVCPKSIEGFHRDIPSTDKELKVFDDMGHSLLSEANRGAVFSHITAWLTTRFDLVA